MVTCNAGQSAASHRRIAVWHSSYFSPFKETTMDARKRTLLRVDVEEDEAATKLAVDALMGTKPELRFRFIQERAEFADAEVLDI